MSSALERLVVASQGVVTKRIDLALLEGQEAISRTFRATALTSVGVLLICAAWFALLWCAVLMIGAALPVRLGVFSLLNAIGAVALYAASKRRAHPQTRSDDRTAVVNSARDDVVTHDSGEEDRGRH